MFLLLVKAAHVLSNFFWIGSLMSVGALLSARERRLSPQGWGSATAALYIYRKISVPSFLASLFFGLLLFYEQHVTYLRFHWMHAKLTFVVAMIGLHHILGAKSKREARDEVQKLPKVAFDNGGHAKGATAFTGLLAVLAAFTVVFVTCKSLLIP